ncbi:Na+/H+ antiporter subunit E [Cerasicoccus fimbriatus]|uniref:Na+/H+ antiporter subunit E n=1 Tax=Cerasicoccus fimbriatus TaxID=3014554 RepID=UPI0022B4D7FB|nr:Na+/H+ antiporter subunit E [Cerasicoccus sp. TK19100]
MAQIKKLLCIAEFVLVYLREVIKSNLSVAMDVLTPSHRMKPAKVELFVGDLSERQLLAYTNLITMTPGTLSLDVSPDRQKLLIHAMYVDSPEAVVREMESTLKERIVHVF